MYKHLYNCFKHWYHGGTIYFYSDPHFDDAEMENIRHITADEQVKLINKRLSKNDTIVILGDIGNPEYLKKIRAGYKVLVLGNHDAGATIYKDYVDEVYEGILMISDKLMLSHEPIIGFPFAYNVHGHDHGNRTKGVLHGLNVCAEVIRYTPVCIKNIIESGELKHVDNIHRITIDKATENKRKRK